MVDDQAFRIERKMVTPASVSACPSSTQLAHHSTAVRSPAVTGSPKWEFPEALGGGRYLHPVNRLSECLAARIRHERKRRATLSNQPGL
jgi:hypothetical protein